MEEVCALDFFAYYYGLIVEIKNLFFGKKKGVLNKL